MHSLEEIVAELHDRAPICSPSQLAELACRLLRDKAHQSSLIHVLAESFPFVSLRSLIVASRWHGVCQGGMSDEECDEILAPWFRPKVPPIKP